MNVTYCPTCNTFLYTNSHTHYCRKCRTLLSPVDLDYTKFAELSINERYKLAYKLTSERRNNTTSKFS